MEPTFRISFMETTPAMIEKSTIGPTMNFTRFRKMVPKGLMYLFAKSAWLCISSPTMIARTSAMKICAASDSFFLPVVSAIFSFPLESSL